MERSVSAGRQQNFRVPGWFAGTALLFVMMSGFIAHSVWLGLWGVTNDLTGRDPFWSESQPVVTAIMYWHMITGGLLTVIAPLQLITAIRRRSPAAHRWAGRVMVVIGLFTAFGGILYALARGTTGGVMMDASSTLYGVMMLVAAVQTYRFGRAKRWVLHRRWGWRFTVLVIASWLYRMHYVIWDRLTGGLWTTPDMTGGFDRFQAWGFFLGYAALLELWFWQQGRARHRA